LPCCKYSLIKYCVPRIPFIFSNVLQAPADSKDRHLPRACTNDLLQVTKYLNKDIQYENFGI